MLLLCSCCGQSYYRGGDSYKQILTKRIWGKTAGSYVFKVFLDLALRDGVTFCVLSMCSFQIVIGIFPNSSTRDPFLLIRSVFVGTGCDSLINLNIVKIFWSNHWGFIVVVVATKINFCFQGIVDLCSCVHPCYIFFCCVDGNFCQFACCSTFSFAFHIWFLLSWWKAQRFYFILFFLDYKWEVFGSSLSLG